MMQISLMKNELKSSIVMVFFSKKSNLNVQIVFLKQKIQVMISQTGGMDIETYEDIKNIYLYNTLKK